MPKDIRTQKLAQVIVDYSLRVKKHENVIISGSTEAEPFIVELFKAIILKGGHPILNIHLPGVDSFFYKFAKNHQIEKFPNHFDFQVKNAQKYIGIDSEYNTRDLTGADSSKITKREKILDPIRNYIVNERNKIWRCSVAYPTVALAQEAEMSLDEYEDFVYRACLQNWMKLSNKNEKILKLIKKTKNVHLVGPGVDLKFKINGKMAKADSGEENMPGGEIYVAPEKLSLEGWIKFDYPAIRSGKEVLGIRLEFKKGRVIKYDATKNRDLLTEMLKTDKGSSYIGELGIGCNPKINKFTKNLLFDEKINGTIHLALGMADKDNGGGNDSAIHWDIVKDMKKGKIILDGKERQVRGAWKI